MKACKKLLKGFYIPLARQIEQKSVAFQIIKINFILCAINALFLSISNAFQLTPYVSYLYTGDLFADYFKVVFSYLGGHGLKLPHGKGIWEVLRSYLANNPYHGAEGLREFVLTHFHLPPFTTLFCLLNLRAMAHVNPIVIFCLFIVLLLLCVWLIGKEVAGNRKMAFAWTACIVVSYPVLFALQRANLFALMTCLLVMASLLLFYKKKHIFLALLMLSLAVNIRPNAGIFIAGLFMTRDIKWLQKILFFGIVAVAIFFGSLLWANFLYPDYTLQNFLSGLKIYHYYYVIKDDGLAFSSSLLSFLKVFFGYHAAFELFGLFVAGVVTFAGAWLYYVKSISASVFAFFLCAAYGLGTSVFAEYHSVVFFIPLLLMSMESGGRVPSLSFESHGGVASASMFFACNLILCPKTYVRYHGIPVLVILDPIIMLVGVALIAYAAVSYFGIRAKAGAQAQKLALWTSKK